MNINRKILNFTVPNIISNITVPLLGLVDMALMGHMESVAFIGAIALGSALFNVIYWSFGFLRMSTSGLAAQAFGKGDVQESGLLLLRALAVSFSGGLLLWILQIPIELVGFHVLGGSEEVQSFGREYFRIRIWAAPASISIFALTGWFLGMHNARIPMTISIAINLLNIVFNAFFVLVLGMRSDGVALGTVIAQYGGLLLAFYFLWKRFPETLPFLKWRNLFPLREFKMFLSVSGDIFIRTLFVILTFTFFIAKSANQGDVILGVNSLFREFIMLFALIMDGFAYAAEPIVGGMLGRKAYLEIRPAIKKIFIWGTKATAVLTLLFWGGSDFLIRLLTDQEAVINAAQPYMWYVALIPVSGFAAFLWDGIYIGFTSSRQMLFAVLISCLCVFFPVYYIFEPAFGNHALWWAILGFFASRGIIQTLLADRAIYRRIPAIT